MECYDESLGKDMYKSHVKGHLGGSLSGTSNFSLSHDLTVHGFKPHIGLCADSTESASDSLSPSLPAPPLFVLCFSLSKINKH